jgi:signal peptidase I
MNIKEAVKSVYKFMKKDSWASLVITLGIAALFILYIFFPLLQWLTGTTLPLVIVESCSMYHDEVGFEKIITNSIYSRNNIELEDTNNWIFKKGLTKGDIIFVMGPKNIEKGDVIIFQGGSAHPIIHRVVDSEEPYATKGDNYKTNSGQLSGEKLIIEEQLIGKAVFKIPYLGWVKLIFFDIGSDNPGRCKI